MKQQYLTHNNICYITIYIADYVRGVVKNKNNKTQLSLTARMYDTN